MSDYCPPTKLMHINDLSEDSLRLIFATMSLVQQLNAGQVCERWRQVQTDLCRTKKSLIVVLDPYSYLSWEFKQYLKNHDQRGGRSLKTTGLNAERVASLGEIFPNITELTVLSEFPPTFKNPLDQLTMLLSQYQNQLVKFNLKAIDIQSEFTEPDHSGAALFFNAINAMSQLKHLSLNFDNSPKFKPFDLPLLAQLDSLKFICRPMPVSILKRWAPVLEARSKPMEIYVIVGNFSHPWDSHVVNVKHFLELSPKVAAMFIGLPDRLDCSLEQLRQLTVNFANLTELHLDDEQQPTYSASVLTLLRTLSSLTKLTVLTIYTHCPETPDPVASAGPLPQLPSVDDLLLRICFQSAHRQFRYRYGIYSHDILNRWTANIGTIFPNLEDVTVCLQRYVACRDCSFKAHISEDDAEDFEEALDDRLDRAGKCLQVQLRPLKQQLPKLDYAYFYWSQMYIGRGDFTIDAHCSLKDVTD